MKNIFSLAANTLEVLVTNQPLGQERWQRLQLLVDRFMEQGKPLAVSYDKARVTVRDQGLPIGNHKTFQKDLALINFLNSFIAADEAGRERMRKKITGKSLKEMGLLDDRQAFGKALDEIIILARPNVLDDLAGPTASGKVVSQLRSRLEATEVTVAEKELLLAETKGQVEELRNDLQEAQKELKKLQLELVEIKNTPEEERMVAYEGRISHCNQRIAGLHSELEEVTFERDQLLVRLQSESDRSRTLSGNFKIFQKLISRAEREINRVVFLIEQAGKKRDQPDKRQEALELLGLLADDFRSVLAAAEEQIVVPKSLTRKPRRRADRLPKVMEGFRQTGEKIVPAAEYHQKFTGSLRKVAEGDPALKGMIVRQLEQFCLKGSGHFETERDKPSDLTYPEGIFRSWLVNDWYITWGVTYPREGINREKRIIRIIRLENFPRRK